MSDMEQVLARLLSPTLHRVTLGYFEHTLAAMTSRYVVGTQSAFVLNNT